MPRIRIVVLSSVITVLLLILSACSPLLNLPGKQLLKPSIENSYYISADGVKLPIRSWLPEDNRAKAIIVALHGFNDYSNFFDFPGKYLSSHGIACYAYDQRGFGGAPGRGLWSGVKAYTNDLSSFVTETRKRHPNIPLYIVGESMGGAVTIVTMTEENPPPADGVILVAPAVWGRETMPWYQRWLLAVTSHTLPWMTLTGKSLHVVPSDNREMLRALSRDPLVIKETRIDTIYGLTNLMDAALLRAKMLHLPTLVQYGMNDQIIPKKPIFLMLATMPLTTRAAFYTNGYHMLLRDLQGQKPLADIVAWIEDHNSALPYGTSRWE